MFKPLTLEALQCYCGDNRHKIRNSFFERTQLPPGNDKSVQKLISSNHHME